MKHVNKKCKESRTYEKLLYPTLVLSLSRRDLLIELPAYAKVPNKAPFCNDYNLRELFCLYSQNINEIVFILLPFNPVNFFT